MPALPALSLGIQTLTEAIQLNPPGPAQFVLSTSRNIIQMVEANKSESQDTKRLALLVLDIAVVYSEGMMKLDEKERNSSDIKRISSNLFSCLDTVSLVILSKSKRGWFTRTLGSSATKKILQGCEADLLHLSSILETQIQIRNVKDSEAIAVGCKSIQAERIFEERVSQAHQETLDLIKSQVIDQRRQKLERSSFAHFPPVASPIFFGRSDLVGQLVDSLVNVPAYHAILGPGGIGKTSLALNVLHDPRVIAVYGSHRYFLACETTADARGMIAGISDIFNLEERSFMKSFRRYCNSIKANMLFLLDNFETPWEKLETRPKVEELLTQLCDIPNISIIVTLRGAERPYGVQWTRPFLPIVTPLNITAARQTFVSIADIKEDDADMTTLLEEVGGIPLAITLLAAQAQYVSCANLLSQWGSCKTSMVTRGWESRLSSLDMSISLSLTSDRFTSNPIAMDLLQNLSLLPDGATIEELVAMSPNGFDVHRAVSTLFQVALVSTSAHDRICALAPIREYVQSKHPMSQLLLASSFSYHAGLSAYAYASQMTAESLVMEVRLGRCIGNIHSVLQACLRVDALTEESIKAAINVSSFRRDQDLGSVALLLQESTKHASLLRNPLLHAACLMEIGNRMINDPDSYADAEAYLKESVDLLRKLPENSDQLVATLTCLTRLFYLQGRHGEGIQCGQESVRLIKESTAPVTAASAYIQLGAILVANSNLQEGINAIDLAASFFEPSQYPILALRYSLSLCWGYFRRSMLSKAIEVADVSLNLKLNMGHHDAGTRRHQRAAVLLGYRGRSYMFSGRYEDAIKDLEESIDTLASYGLEHQIGEPLTFLGIARLGSNDLKAASTAFQVALQIPYSTVYVPLKQCMAALELCRGRLDQALIYCDKAKRDVYQRGAMSFANSTLLQVQSQVHIRRGDAAEALSMSVVSVVRAYKIGDGVELASHFLVLGDAYFFIDKDIGSAKACYQACLDLMRYLGFWRWIANTLMRLGVMDHLLGDSSLAARRLNQAIEFYEKTAGTAWAEFCKERLRLMDLGMVEENIPFFPPVFECF